MRWNQQRRKQSTNARVVNKPLIELKDWKITARKGVIVQHVTVAAKSSVPITTYSVIRRIQTSKIARYVKRSSVMRTIMSSTSKISTT